MREGQVRAVETGQAVDIEGAEAQEEFADAGWKEFRGPRLASQVCRCHGIAAHQRPALILCFGRVFVQSGLTGFENRQKSSKSSLFPVSGWF